MCITITTGTGKSSGNCGIKRFSACGPPVEIPIATRSTECVPAIAGTLTTGLVLGGAIASGSAILAALALGADLAYIGTRFIATHEANADARYKQMIVDCGSADIVYSSLFTGVNGNYLKPSIVASGLNPDALANGEPSALNFGGGNIKAWRDVWGAGQGTGNIDAVASVAEVVRQLRTEFAVAKGSLTLSSEKY